MGVQNGVWVAQPPRSQEDVEHAAGRGGCARGWARCGLRERWGLARGTAACAAESGQRAPSTLANAWPLWCCRSALASFASMGVAAHGPHQPRRLPGG